MGDVRIDRLIRTGRKSVALMIGPDATLTVRAPYRMPLPLIEQWVREKSGWIAKKLAELARHSRPEPKKFIEGEEFRYLGKSYRLRLVDFGPISLEEDLSFPGILLPDARRHLTDWYHRKAEDLFRERCDHFSRCMGLKAGRIRVKTARSRWGSCGANGDLNFNWRLVMAPLDIIDYVVVHELAHLIERNHSSRFWGRIQAQLPDHKDRRRWLKDNAQMLMF